MIDYEKLKLVHKMYPQGYLKIIPIFDDDAELLIMNYEFKIEKYISNYFRSIDDLIDSFKKITKIKTKYEIGQTVWRLNDEDLPNPLIIAEIDYQSEPVYRDLIGNWWEERQLHSSRDALIESQIAYWMSLKNKKISTCSENVSITTTF